MQNYEDLLNKVSEHFGILPKDLLERLERDHCHWVYARSSKGYKKGDRCKSPVFREDYVFCENHHKQASKSTNVIVISPGDQGITRQVYLPDVGVAECLGSKGKSVLTLLQGDRQKMLLKNAAIKNVTK